MKKKINWEYAFYRFLATLCIFGGMIFWQGNSLYGNSFLAKVVGTLFLCMGILQMRTNEEFDVKKGRKGWWNQ